MSTTPYILAKPNLPLRLVLVVAVGTAALDQLTKYLILMNFLPGEILPIIPEFFNLTLTFNLGAAFGLWSALSDGLRETVLALTNLVALGVVVYFMRQPSYSSRAAQTALAGILGGAIGNIIDRFVRGSVVDFLDFHIGTTHWPAFNVADSAICTGVVVLLLLSFLGPEETASREITSTSA
jgi:signal peptidase II